jgi:hypothetical protein
MAGYIANQTDEKIKFVTDTARHIRRYFRDSKISLKIKPEVLWLDYAFKLTDGFTKDIGQWTTEFICSRIRELLVATSAATCHEVVAYYLVCLLAYLDPDKVGVAHSGVGSPFAMVRL